MFVPYAHDGTDKTTLRKLRALKLVNEADDQKGERQQQQQHHHHQDEDENALIVDGSPTLTARTDSNAVVYLLGAGAPAKNATMYMANYMTKDSVQRNASATVLADAAKHNREHPSTTDDKDKPERPRKWETSPRPQPVLLLLFLGVSANFCQDRALSSALGQYGD